MKKYPVAKVQIDTDPVSTGVARFVAEVMPHLVEQVTGPSNSWGNYHGSSIHFRVGVPRDLPAGDGRATAHADWLVRQTVDYLDLGGRVTDMGWRIENGKFEPSISFGEFAQWSHDYDGPVSVTFTQSVDCSDLWDSEAGRGLLSRISRQSKLPYGWDKYQQFVTGFNQEAER